MTSIWDSTLYIPDFDHPFEIRRFIMAPMTPTPSLAQLLKHAIEGRLLDVHTAIIAKVESYDAAKQLVNVAPVLKRSIENMRGEWIAEQLPVLCDVPVLFPRAGGFFISFPIQPGDFVQLIFNGLRCKAPLPFREFSLNPWRLQGLLKAI